MAYILEYVSHSCLKDCTIVTPCFSIKLNSSFLILGSLLALWGAAFLPQVSAFWPFSNADAAAVTTTVPGSVTPVLRAATNPDPNPNKGIGDTVTRSGDALLAFSGPGGTIADVATSTPPDHISVYVVRQGDTLAIIAKMFGVSVNTIVWANNLRGVSDVRPGDTLIILPVSGLEHTIVKGDTLNSLAKKFGADADEIAQYNGLDPSDPLQVGATIIIPGGELGGPAPSFAATPKKRIGSEPYLGGSGSAIPGYFGNPLPGGVITQGIHGWNGVDIAAARGTPVRAAASGTVIISRNGGYNGGYGNYVVITHDNGTQTLYSHLRSSIVSPGESVLSGQIIGYVGTTGKTTGPHLHFEVRGAANPFRNCPVGSSCAPQ